MFSVGLPVEEGFSTTAPNEAFTIVTSHDPDGAAFLTPANIAAIDDAGNYLIRFIPTNAGTYYANWRGESSLITLDGNWLVERGAVALGGEGFTRRELRRRVGGASGLGDVVVLTADAGSTDVTLIDLSHLTLPTGAYLGRELTMVDGLNSGELRRVSGNSELAHSLTVQPAYLFPILPGEEGELWNASGTGWHKEEVDSVLNDIITEARSGYWIPQLVNGEVTFDQTNPYIAIPDSFSHVSGVGWQDGAGIWQDIGAANYSGGPGWYVEAGMGIIRLSGAAAASASNHVTQIRGYGPLPELRTDDERTPLNVEWLVKEAFARLLLTGLARRPDNQVRYPAAVRRADQSRGWALRRPMANTVRVA